jgi:parvulin-like peptidyl-prolyl isomerase
MMPAEIEVTVSPFGYHIVQCISNAQDSVHIRHILITVTPTRADTLQTRKLAESVRKRLLAGDDFAVLAKEYSDDVQTRDKGGELGAFPMSELSPQYKDILSSMKPGESSEVVPSEFGLQIIKLLERVEGKMPTFDDVKDDLREVIYQRKMSEKYTSWLDKLKKGIYIEKRL